MPVKPRDQWVPNPKLQAAREGVHGRKSRTPFANAVKRRCEERFGGHCGVDHRKIRRWEEGACVPDLCHQEVICDLFEVPWEEREQLGFGTPEHSHPSPTGRVPEVALVLDKPAAELGRGIVMVNGQGAEPAVFGAVMGLPMMGIDDLKHIAAAMDDARRYFDRRVIDYFRRQLHVCAADDGTRGPQQTLPKVLGIIGALERKIREVKPALRPELLVLGAQCSEFVGWLYRDLGVLGWTRYWHDQAMEWAQAAGDRELQGYVLLRKSQAAWDERDGLRMLTLAQAAQEGPWQLTPRVRAEAIQQEARAQAMIGDPLHLIERKLEEARELMEKNGAAVTAQAGSHVAGSHYNASLLALQTAICYVEVGQPRRAIDIYRGSLRHDAFSHRDYGYFRALMGLSLAAAGEPDEAVKVGSQALPVAVATKSARTIQELWRLVEGGLRSWPNRPSVRELRDALLSLHDPGLPR